MRRQLRLRLRTEWLWPSEPINVTYNYRNYELSLDLHSLQTLPDLSELLLHSLHHRYLKNLRSQNLIKMNHLASMFEGDITTLEYEFQHEYLSHYN